MNEVELELPVHVDLTVGAKRQYVSVSIGDVRTCGKKLVGVCGMGKKCFYVFFSFFNAVSMKEKRDKMECCCVVLCRW